MRIHTDKMTAVRQHIYQATGALPGVYAEVSEHGSRSRRGALELRLTGNGTRRPNSGRWGAEPYGGEYAATWDEWGVVIAAVYAADPDAIWGSAKRPVYAGADDFHWQTGERFAHVALILEVGDYVLLMPEDTHAVHMWDYVAQGTRECRKCSATSYAPIRG